MVSIKTWKEFESFRRSEHKLVIYGSENKKSFINFFNENISFCDKDIANSEPLFYDGKKFTLYSISDLLISNEPIDIIVSPQINYPNVMRLTRYFMNSSQEHYLFFGKARECLTLNGNSFEYKSALLLNYGVDKIYGDLNIPIHTYVQQIDSEIYKAYDVIVDYTRNYSLKDYLGVYVNHVFGKRKTFYQPQYCDQHLHIFGDSRVYGFGVEDKFTFSSLLQNILNAHDMKIAVENHGMFDDAEPFIGGVLNRISTLNLAPKDIVIYCLPVHWIYSNTDVDKAIFYLIKEIKNKCTHYGARFICVNLPDIQKINQNTEMEMIFVAELKNSEEINPIINSVIKEEIFKLLTDSIYVIDIQKCFDQPRIYPEVFLDHIHYLKSGNELVAQAIYEKIYPFIKIDHGQLIYNKKDKPFPQEMVTECIQNLKKKINELYKSEIYDYLEHIKKPNDIDSKIMGAIVVNCNPFTNGHLKIIEFASSQVDYLYIFVVEEDDSCFSFKDRFHLVKENTTHIHNVIVNPSGYFIISKLTFPGYFEKENHKEDIVDCTNDLLIFGSNIAPALNIAKRFVGKEPFCNVTRKYNEKMKVILPMYNIDVVEIDRFCLNNEYISASRVRKLFEENNNEIEALVPKITYDYLMHIQNLNKNNGRVSKYTHFSRH